VGHGEVKAALELAYRATLRTKLKAEGIYLRTGMKSTKEAIAEMEGVLKGLKQAIDIVEQIMGDNSLPGMEVRHG
jgi:hypothetical protein